MENETAIQEALSRLIKHKTVLIIAHRMRTVAGEMCIRDRARALAAALPEKNVLFAFALSAGHREADRVVSIDLKKITIGQLTGATSNKQLIGHIFHLSLIHI